ncbi:MAG: peptide ABC transporter substrate-binding protein [Alphaproteobacteria bacterium]
MRWTRMIAAVVTGMLILSACGKAPAPQTLHEEVLRRGNTADPDTLDPQKTSTQWESNILNDMFEGLMAMDAKANVIHGAAESHTVSPDGLVWIFKLRQGTWSDGVPLTAEDFVFSFRRILDPKTAAKYASLVYPIKNARAVNEGRRPLEAVGVKAIDPRTLEITLEQPTPYLPQLLTHITCQPVPRHVIEKAGDAWIKPGTMVTNGPYVLAEWIPNASITVVKNPHYHDAANVGIEEVVYYPISDESVELKRYRAGEIDYTASLPARALADLRKEFGSEVHVHPVFYSHYILFNVRKAPFDDVRVREALSLAIDRETIASKVLNAGQIPADSFVPPEIANYAERGKLQFSGEPLEERRKRAIALLAQAGFGAAHPLKLTYRYREGLDQRRIAVAVQDLWKSIGVQAELLNSEGRVHFNALRTQDYDVAHANWIADYNDAENFLFLFQSSAGQMNYTKFSNAQYDDLMRRASVTMDLGARAGVLRQAEQMMLDAHPIAPLFFDASRRLVRRSIAGYEDNVLDYHLSRYMRVGRS